MLPISGQRILVLLLMLLPAVHCKQGPQPEKTLLPMPGAPLPASGKVIRPTLDKSPMDMIYFPADYPILKMSGKITGDPIARVIYSRPDKDGRVIFGNVVKYGERWRLGANEATEIEFFRDVTIQGKKIRKGRYVLCCIPYADKWTMILNDDLFVWGLKIHASKDLYSFDIPVLASSDIYQALTMEFEPGKDGMQLAMAWDNVRAILAIQY